VARHRLTRIALIAAVPLAVALLSAGPAAAQTGSTTTTSAPAVTNQVTLSNDQSVNLALISLVFGICAIVAVLFFLSRDRVRSFALLGRLSLEGRSVSVHTESSLAAAASRSSADEVSIHGPQTIAVGQPVAYTLVGVETQSATWAITGEGTLSATTGTTVRVTATVPGGLRLSATFPESNGDSTVVVRDLIAEKPLADTASSVPILGQGYGTVVIALSVAAVTAALGLTKVLDGQAVAGILGSLVTYSVTRAVGGTATTAGADS
jgi:hypothetical protein